MPEGDTIFRSARALGRALVGKTITGFRSTFPLLSRFNDDTPLAGQLVTGVESRGKWLLIHFSGGGTLATHMLMSGSWHIYRHGEPWQQPRSNMRIVIESSDYVVVGFRIPVARMHTAPSLARDRKIPGSLNDVLNMAFDPEAAARRLLTHSNEDVGDALLHQQILAGVGNVFKSEICFVTGVNPFSRVAELSAEQITAMIVAAQRLLAANVLEDSDDAIVTFKGHRRTTRQSEPGASLWVYGRKGKPCRRCGDPVRRRLQGRDARVTYWCQHCQPMPDGSNVDG